MDPSIMDTTRFRFDMASVGLRASATKDGGQVVLERAPETVEIVVPKKPPLYKVIIHNDDTTPFPFVWHILEKYFEVGFGRAQQIAMTVHEQGCCVIACYSKEIAEDKVERSNAESRRTAHPNAGRPGMNGTICPPYMELLLSYEQDGPTGP